MRIPSTCLLLFVSLATTVVQAQSLAPPHSRLVAGEPVVVTAHPDQAFLLQQADPQQATNKRRVYDFWRTVILAGRTDTIDRYLAEDFVEHNPLLPSGRQAFTDYISSRTTPQDIPAEIPDLVTLVAEGPYVVMATVTYYPEADGTGTYTSTHFEMFRLDAGLIAEHWDSWLFRSDQRVPNYGANAARPVLGITGTAQFDQLYSDDPDLFVAKRLVFDLWRHIPESGREELADLFMDPIYIQHNPNAATGRDGAVAYFSNRPDTPISTTLEAPLVAMIAEGDLVVQVLETDREQNGVNYKVPWFDMFRLENGRVIEHWDTASKGELPPIMQGLPLP